jgi:hypothetical protein
MAGGGNTVTPCPRAPNRPPPSKILKRPRCLEVSPITRLSPRSHEAERARERRNSMNENPLDLVSVGPARRMDPSGRAVSARHLWSALLLFIGGCTSVEPRPAEQHSVETKAGRSFVEVHGVAGGLTNSGLTKLVEAGIKQGCPGPVPPGIRAIAGPSLSMIWNVNDAGSPHPSVIVTARLLSAGHLVSFAFDRTISPGTAPHAVFEYAIAEVTCSLFRKAGYLSAAHRSAPENHRSE